MIVERSKKMATKIEVLEKKQKEIKLKMQAIKKAEKEKKIIAFGKLVLKIKGANYTIDELEEQLKK